MTIRKFEFKDQSIIFDWWNQEGLKKQLPVYSKAGEWTQRLLKNPFAYIVEHENKVIGVIEFLALYESHLGNIAKVFYFTPQEQAEQYVQSAIEYQAQELKEYKITQVQFYQWKPMLIEVWLPQVEDKPQTAVVVQEVEEVKEKEPEPKKRIKKNGSNKPKPKPEAIAI